MTIVTIILSSFAHFINFLCQPALLYLLAIALLYLGVRKRYWIIRPRVAIPAAAMIALAFSLSLLHPHFRHLVTRSDNIAIILFLTCVIYFTWYSLKRAWENDHRRHHRRPLIEEEQDQMILVWPNLVYIELIAAIAITAFLIVWALVVAAPLEGPANPAVTPNPSKAPWYFVGLQEMLVYFDPWLAGVVYPVVMILALCALPYLDPNPKGNGYYTFKERPLAIGFFLFFFLINGVLLIIIGTFLRGPGWNFYGPFESWDVYKSMDLTNVNLSELFWSRLFGFNQPSNIALREAPGIFAVTMYLFALPVILARTLWRHIYQQMSLGRYMLLCFFALVLMALPIKMLLRWTLNIKYILAIPEWFFNI